MDILEKLFSSGTLVKVMRLFLFHPRTPYDKDMLVEATGSNKKNVTYETKLLSDIGFLKSKTFTKKVETKKGERNKKTKGWILDTAFPYITQLEQLLTTKNLVSDDSVVKRLRSAGTFKLIALSGVFTGERDGGLDLLLVATRTKKRNLRTTLAKLESAIGTELAYAVFDPEEFVYRASVRDRLIRNVFEHSYRIVLNTLPNEALPQV